MTNHPSNGAPREQTLYITTSVFWRRNRHRLAYVLRVCQDGKTPPIITCNCPSFARGVCKHVLALSARLAKGLRRRSPGRASRCTCRRKGNVR